MKFKTTKYLIFLLSMFATNTFAQNNEQGIYLTQSELSAGTVNIAFDQSTNICEEFDRLIVSDETVRQKYKFGKVAGYRKAGVDYRSYGSTGFFQSYGYYKIINRDGLILYSRMVRGYKVSHIEYYYSTSLESPIKRLILKNLIHDFNKPEFVDALSHFKNKDLRMQCGLENYKINSIYTAIFN